jgi:hypothetical protein
MLALSTRFRADFFWDSKLLGISAPYFSSCSLADSIAVKG